MTDVTQKLQDSFGCNFLGKVTNDYDNDDYKGLQYNLESLTCILPTGAWAGQTPAEK